MTPNENQRACRCGTTADVLFIWTSTSTRGLPSHSSSDVGSLHSFPASSRLDMCMLAAATLRRHMRATSSKHSETHVFVNIMVLLQLLGQVPTLRYNSWSSPL